MLRFNGGTAISLAGTDGIASANPPVEIGVRPEHVSLTDPDDPQRHMRGSVVLVERLGNLTIAYVDTEAGQVVVELNGKAAIRVDDHVGLAFDLANLHLFGADGRVLGRG